jgi:hypothetical protein
MGRINAGILSVTVVALLALTMPTLAQENEHKEKPASTSSAAMAKHSIWKEKGDGVWEAYIPRFADDEEGKEKPEFAAVRLTADRYAEFQKGSRDFLNDHKIFSHNVKVLESCTATKPKKEDPKSAYWYLIVAHWPGSTAACQAYPGWSEPK